MKKQWIFNSFTKDFFALWGLAFPLIALLVFVPQGKAWGFLALIAYVFIDSGHAYATAFRTYFDKKVLFSNPLYFWVPLFCFMTLFTWSYLGLPYLWSFILYATFYHNTRQHFGILKWYEKLNGKAPNSSLFLYALTILPFIGFHFKKFEYSGIYHKDEFFFLPNSSLFIFFVLINALTLFAFLIASRRYLRINEMSRPVFFSILFPGLVNFCCFSLGSTIDQVLLPIVVIHGVAYYFLTAKVLEHNKQRKRPMYLWLAPILVVSIGLAFLEYWTQINFMVSAASVTYKGQIGLALAVCAVTVPLVTHYILDGLIWRKTDPEFAKLFS